MLSSIYIKTIRHSSCRQPLLTRACQKHTSVRAPRASSRSDGNQSLISDTNYDSHNTYSAKTLVGSSGLYTVNNTATAINATTIGKTRSYHCSSSTLAPVRRRRRTAAAATDENEAGNDDDLTTSSNNESSSDGSKTGRNKILQHDAVTDIELFNQQAEILLNKVMDAMKPLKQVNPNMFISRGVDEGIGEYVLIDLGPDGQYNMQIDQTEKMLLFVSPLSGQFEYIFSNQSQRWVGRLDGHIFEGLLVRDLIRQIHGVPQL